ncbi:MAG: FapA family protein [Bacillota bacterium]|nr:FapA family protein [Bacillota bacterium]
MNGDTVNGEPGSSAEAAPKKPVLHLNVTGACMKAYLRVTPTEPDQKVLYEDVLALLDENGIVFGVDEDAVRKFCDGSERPLLFACAQGREPVNEIAPQPSYHFDIEKKARPQEREDGTVDFRNLGLIQNVKAGQVLVSVDKPAPGEEGTDIYGRPVAYIKAKMPELPRGSNTVLSEDGLKLLAEIDGCVEYRKSRVNVSDVLTIDGDVDASRGNIDFGGTVVIRGDVRESYSVTAGRDITVRGMVESANLTAGGNITISDGMNGMGKGYLKAGGNVTGRYFENVNIECQGDVCADVLMNSTVKAGGAIVLRGRNALIVGGSYEAGSRVYAGTIGNENQVRTKVEIVSEKCSRILCGDTDPEDVKLRLSAAKSQLSELTASANEMMLSLTNAGDDKFLLVKAKMAAEEKKRLETLIEQLEKKAAEADMAKRMLSGYKIVVLKTIYAGTRIGIGGVLQTLTSDYSHTKFYADPEKIVTAPILPSDVDH